MSDYIVPYVLGSNMMAIPQGVLRCEELNPVDKAMWAAIADRAQIQNEVHASLEELAADLDISKDSASDSIQDLIDEGFIERKRRYRRSSSYRLLQHPAFLTPNRTMHGSHEDDVYEIHEEPTWNTEQFAQLSNFLIEYMQRPETPGASYAHSLPDRRILKRIQTAANGASLEEVLKHLRWCYNNQCSPRHPNGPRGWGWFVSAVTQQFQPDVKPIHRPKRAPSEAWTGSHLNPQTACIALVDSYQPEELAVVRRALEPHSRILNKVPDPETLVKIIQSVGCSRIAASRISKIITRRFDLSAPATVRCPWPKDFTFWFNALLKI